MRTILIATLFATLAFASASKPTSSDVAMVGNDKPVISEQKGAPSAERLKEAFPIVGEYNVAIEEVKEDESLYVYKALVPTRRGVDQPIVFYVTKDLRRIIFGEAFDQSGQKITIATDMSGLEKEAAWQWGTGKEKYYVFTDPECPFCQKMEKAFSDPSAGTYYFFLYPLSFHPNAVDMSIYILSQEDAKKGGGHEAAIAIAQGKDYKVALSKIDPKKREAYRARINANTELGTKLGVSGTPSIFNVQGKHVDWTRVVR
jgi:thiol:disulfide interchange protein DsbC